MKLKRLTALLLSLVLFFLSGASALAEDLEATDAISDAESVTQEETVTVAPEDLPDVDAMTGEVTVVYDEALKKNVVRIDGVAVDDKILSEVKNAGLVSFGFTEVLKTFGKTFIRITVSEIKKKIQGGQDYSKDLTDIKLKLQELSAKLDKVSAQVDDATKEILGAVEASAMKTTLGQISTDANKINVNYYETLQIYLEYIQQLFEQKFTDEGTGQLTAEGINIDNGLHYLYCYYPNDLTSPITGYAYNKTLGETFYKDFVAFGNELTGEMPLGLVNRNIFDLYYGILVYSNNFSSETLETRATMNKYALNYYEKGYVSLNTALRYDEVNHQNQANQTQAAQNLLIQAKTQFSGDALKAIEEEIGRLGVQVSKHVEAVKVDQSHSDTLNNQYQTIQEKYTAAEKKLQEDREENSRGETTCYRNGKKYSVILYVGSVNWGLEATVNDKNQSHMLVTKLAGHRPETYLCSEELTSPYKNEDRVRSNTKYGKVVAMNTLDQMQTWAANRGMTLNEELKLSFKYSVNEDLSNATSYQNCTNSLGLYYSGWQWPKGENNANGCGGPTYMTFNRTVRYLDGANKRDLVTIRKKWITGGTMERQKELYVDISSNEKVTMMLMSDSNAEDDQTDQLQWTKGASGPLFLADCADFDDIKIDDVSLESTQWVAADGGVLIKMSVLEALSVGEHDIAVYSGNAVSNMTLTVDPQDFSDLEAYELALDGSTLADTYAKLESMYPNQIVTILPIVTTDTGDIDNKAIKLIRENAGDCTCEYADVTLKICAGDEVVGTLTSDMLAAPVGVVMKYNASGLKNPTIFRVHDGVCSELTAQANADGESAVFDNENQLIQVTSNKFSVYAIAYANTDSPNTGTAGGLGAIILAIAAMLSALIVLIVYRLNRSKWR